MTLEVTQGSAVAVDTEELRAIAARLDIAAETALRGAGCARQSFQRLALLTEPYPYDSQVQIVSHEADLLAERLAASAGRIRDAADAYEAVELQTTMLMYGGTAQGAAASARLGELLGENPTAVGRALTLMSAWRLLTNAELPDHFASAIPGTFGTGGPSLAFGFLTLLAGFRMLNGMGPGSLGEPRRTAARQGVAPALSTAPIPMIVKTLEGQTAPRSLAESLHRIPNGEGDGPPRRGHGDQDRVRIDRYTFPDGESRFVVYVTGSREFPLETDDPFAWEQNLDLYTGEPGSEGYAFVLDALRRAGAEEGDVVDANGFSQGAMISQRLATDSGFDVQNVTTIGAPLHIPMGDGTTAVTLMHSDDPVAALADGGSPARLGSDGSLLIERAFQPEHTSVLELGAPAHRVGAYAETAELFAQSGDPRAQDLAAYYEMLAGASEVDSFVFEAYEGRPEETSFHAPGLPGPPAAEPSA